MIESRPPSVGPDALEFWKGCDEGYLSFQRCANCAHLNWFPRTFCSNCSSSDLRWERGSGRGTVAEATLVLRPLNDSFRDEVPYILAMVALDEGYSMISRVVGDNLDQVRTGDKVQVSFVATTGHSLPVFEKVS